MTKMPYQTLKNVGVKYLAPLALSAALLGGCGKEKVNLPVQSETISYVQTTQKQRISTLIAEYRQSAEEANALYNSDLRDGKLTRKEQEEIYKTLGKSREKRDKVLSYADDIGTSIDGRLKDKATDRLYDLLDENLHGLDYGVPELELALQRQRIHIHVESVHTVSDANVIYLPLMLLIGCYAVAFAAGSLGGRGK